MTLPDFAPQHRHAFVLRGTAATGPLFRPGPVPRGPILERMALPGAALHLARQVHGARIAEYPVSGAEGASGDPGEPVEADALLARAPGHAVGVVTADCLPILLAAKDGSCAAVHAGWRGLVAGVIEAAVERLGGGSGLEAAIGPAIGPCCFEVGPEVVARFAARFPGSAGFARGGDGDRSLIDLPGAAREILATCGVDPGRIREADLCTRCRPDGLLESYRRDGKAAGRMVAVIGRA
jgi:YfiH family protein